MTAAADPARGGHLRGAIRGGWLVLVVIALLGPGCAHGQRSGATAPQATVLLLARHAEKARGQGEDPPLTDAGRRRAAALVDVLHDQPVDAIYVTPFRRTRATAEPLAQARGLVMDEHAPQDAALVEQLLEQHAGQTVLVIGHRSTVPGMLNVLVGEERYAKLPADAHGQLFVVTVCGAEVRVRQEPF